MAANLVAEHTRKGMIPLHEAQGIEALLHCLQQSHPVIQAAESIGKEWRSKCWLCPAGCKH